jgi:pimeloyl-ACP methyl ester carboxylesterase
VPHLDYHVWEGVSHFLMMEQPEKFNSALSVFLEKHQLAN